MQNAPTAAFSITLKMSLDNVPGTMGRFATAIWPLGDKDSPRDASDRCAMVGPRPWEENVSLLDEKVARGATAVAKSATQSQNRATGRDSVAKPRFARDSN